MVVNRISVHITTKDRSSELFGLLCSLENQTFKEWDLVILDDASGTPINTNFKYLHDLFARLKLAGHGVYLHMNGLSFGVCKARQKLVDDDVFKDNAYILRLDDDQHLAVDYVERLVKVMEAYPDAGIVSGVTPLLSGPDNRRKLDHILPVVNHIKLNEQGDLVEYADDCGTLYSEGRVLPAHNFRSSALMKREMFDKGLCYEKGLSLTGFREEFFLSIRAMLMGYKCYVDTGAVAWHAHALSGGCRSNDYAQRVEMDEFAMRRWVKQNFKQIKEVLGI